MRVLGAGAAVTTMAMPSFCYVFSPDLRERAFARVNNLPLKVRRGEDWRDALRRQVAVTRRTIFRNSESGQPDIQ